MKNIKGYLKAKKYKGLFKSKKVEDDVNEAVRASKFHYGQGKKIGAEEEHQRILEDEINFLDKLQETCKQDIINDQDNCLKDIQERLKKQLNEFQKLKEKEKAFNPQMQHYPLDSPRDREASFYVAYVKDVFVAMIESARRQGKDIEDLSALMDRAVNLIEEARTEFEQPHKANNQGQ